MFTTTHLSDHVQDNMTTRQHQPQSVGALPWCHPGHQGTSVGPGQHPRYTDARKGRPWVAQKAAHQATTSRKQDTHSHEDRARLSIYLRGSGAGSLRPQIYEGATELDDKIRLRVFPRSRNVQESTRRPAGELREAPRHVQSDRLHQKQIPTR